MVNTLLKTLPIVALTIISGCASVPLTTSTEPMAISTALTRARFELNCPEASATVLSKQTIQAPMGIRFGGVDRAQFTIGVQGCGKQQTLVVLCADGADGCFAADGRN